MSANQVALSYLAASVLFILALRGLSHPETRGEAMRLASSGWRLPS
jgi:NAD/NADP transhydrogenase beta subunit